MQFARILIFTTVLGAGFGALRDGLLHLGVPAYFSMEMESVFLVGAATWGVFGAILGLGLACAARLGTRPKRTARELRKPVLVLLAVIAGFSIIAGMFGAVATDFGLRVLAPEVYDRLPPQTWAGLHFCWFVQIMGNYVGFVAGGMQVAWVWVSRKRFASRRVKPFSTTG